MKKIFVFEGLSGTGKTTIINNVYRAIDNSCVIKEWTLNQREEDSSSYDFSVYIENDIKKAELIKKSDQEIILVDRFYLSTVFILAARYGIDTYDLARKFIPILYSNFLEILSLDINHIYVSSDSSQSTYTNANQQAKKNVWHDDVMKSRLEKLYCDFAYNEKKSAFHIKNLKKDTGVMTQLLLNYILK